MFATATQPSKLVALDADRGEGSIDAVGGGEVGGAPTFVGTRLFVRGTDVDGNPVVFTRADGDSSATPITLDGKPSPQPETDILALDGHGYFVGVVPGSTQLALYRVEPESAAATTVTTLAGSSINLGAGSTMTTAGGKLLFELRTADAGSEPWVSDGTAEGTHLLKDVNDAENTSLVRVGPSVQFAGKAWLAANDGVHGNELWSTDGTPAGSHLLVDLADGNANTDPVPFVAAGGKLFFGQLGGRIRSVGAGTESGRRRDGGWHRAAPTTRPPELGRVPAAPWPSARPSSSAPARPLAPIRSGSPTARQQARCPSTSRRPIRCGPT